MDDGESERGATSEERIVPLFLRRQSHDAAWGSWFKLAPERESDATNFGGGDISCYFPWRILINVSFKFTSVLPAPPLPPSSIDAVAVATNVAENRVKQREKRVSLRSRPTRHS